MKIASIATRGALTIALLAMPTLAAARGGHHGMFGAAHHGHSINAWMGSHRQRLR